MSKNKEITSDTLPIGASVIKLESVSKKYRLYKNKEDRLKEALHPFRKKYHKDFYALQGIDLNVKKGESLGIMGMNGAGKSTLLKVITGVTTPSSGSLSINGNISALLELGAGFNPDSSGYDNIFFYSTIVGLSRTEMNEKVEEIIEFADIGEYIYQPVKTYSSGMKSRLAFAVATSINPDILILDEVLSVGDMFFQSKCTHRMQNMIKGENTTVLFVSHNLSAVKAICQRCILLQGGEIVSAGNTEEVVADYMNLHIKSRQKIIQKQLKPAEKPKSNERIPAENRGDAIKQFIENNEDFIKRAEYKRLQNGKAEFVNCALLDESEKELNVVEYGQKVILRIAVKVLAEMSKVNVGYHIQNKGITVLYASSITENKFLTDVKESEIYIIDFKFKVEIQQGIYNICIACKSPNYEDYVLEEAEFSDVIYTAYQFEVAVARPRPIYGFVHIDQEMSINQV